MLLEKFPSLAIPEVTRWVTAGLLHIPLRIHQAQEHRNSWAGAPEEEPPAKESHGLYTPHCPHKSRSSSQVFGSCSISASIHSAGFTALHLLWYPKGQQFPAPAVSPTVWLESPVFHAHCYPKAWLLMASCLRLPHRAQSAFQSASQFSGWATWTRSMLSSMRNLIDVCSNS